MVQNDFLHPMRHFCSRYLKKMWLSLLDPTFGAFNKMLDSLGLGFLKHAWLGGIAAPR
ncbi:hypothetical protein ACFSQ7_16435 [Paenibacillus rhizoplanae]